MGWVAYLRWLTWVGWALSEVLLSLVGAQEVSWLPQGGRWFAWPVQVGAWVCSPERVVCSPSMLEIPIFLEAAEIGHSLLWELVMECSLSWQPVVECSLSWQLVMECSLL